MIEKLVPLALPPGYYNSGTTYQAKNRWFRGSLVRFFQNTIQPIGGWTTQDLAGVPIVGVPRAMVSYQQLDGNYASVVGTTGGLYAIMLDIGTGILTVYDITPGDPPSLSTGAGLAATLAGGTDDRLTWTLATFGNFVIADYKYETAVANVGLSIGGRSLNVWDGDPTHTAEPTPFVSGEFPLQVNATTVTPEKFVLALGAADPQQILTTGDDPDPRLVWWSSQATTDDWYPSDVNSAGSFSLASPGVLMAGAPYRGQTLLWTTRDLWAMTFIGQPLIYGFQQVGLECGIISSRAAVVTSNASYWMSNNRFFRYDGFVTPLTCDVADYIFGNMNTEYNYKIWALHNPQFSEVTWFYVSTDATEIDSYVTFNYVENHWVFGSLNRTAGVPAQVPGLVPVMADETGIFYNHETGTLKDGRLTFAESGPAEIGDGDMVCRIQRIVPDDRTLGDVNATIYTSLFPDAAEQTHGPYTLSNPTSVRATARQARLRLEEVNHVAWRVGVVRMGIIPGGRR